MAVTQSKGSVRERIVETACRLFFEQGYRATGINQIISESGVAKASFYDHFPSKNDLLLEYVKHMSEREMQDFYSSVGALATPEERFWAPLRMAKDWLVETNFRGCPFQNVLAEMTTAESTEVRDAVRLHRERERGFIRKLAKEYVAAHPELAHIDYGGLADMYMVMFEGVVATCSSLGDLWPVDRAESSIRSYLAGMASP